jgi:hypothetical protein
VANVGAVSQSRSLLLDAISRECLLTWLDLYENAMQIEGIKLKDAGLSQFSVVPYAYLQEINDKLTSYVTEANHILKAILIYSSDN